LKVAGRITQASRFDILIPGIVRPIGNSLSGVIKITFGE
jgi:hypothetical protein